jgi:hypothetical protein
VWPIGVAAVIGIALGFGGGYTVAIRDRAVTPVAATTSAAVPPPQLAVRDIADVPVAPVVPTPVAEPAAPPSTQKPTPAAASAALVTPAFAGRVLVRSTPSGARVLVDGKDRGQTPATIRELGRGEHRVRIVRDGYTTAERRVVLSSSQPSQSLSVPLAKEPRPGTKAPVTSRPAPAAVAAAASAVASLVVESRPQGAAVIIDGRQVGTTPLSLSDVRTGSHAVRLERDGYRIWTAPVTVSAGEQNRVTASLEK